METLEQQVILERIDVGDSERVRHQRARSAAPPRPDRDAVLPRVADEIPDHQKVALEPHRVDDPELCVQAGVVLRGRGASGPLVGQPTLKALPSERLQEVLRELPSGNRIPGEIELALREGHVAPGGDLLRETERFGAIAEQARHLVR
jgi:hypothetical protein